MHTDQSVCSLNREGDAMQSLMPASRELARKRRSPTGWGGGMRAPASSAEAGMDGTLSCPLPLAEPAARVATRNGIWQHGIRNWCLHRSMSTHIFKAKHDRSINVAGATHCMGRCVMARKQHLWNMAHQSTSSVAAP